MDRWVNRSCYMSEYTQDRLSWHHSTKSMTTLFLRSALQKAWKAKPTLVMPRVRGSSTRTLDKACVSESAHMRRGSKFERSYKGTEATA